MVTLKNRHGQLENQYENKIYSFKQQLSASKGQGRNDWDENADREDQSVGLSHWGKQISPSKKTKSHNSMYRPVSDVEAMDRMIRNKKIREPEY